ncbi:beta-ketoacyl-ACP synthase III [Balneolaceae bacterium ANBcel3]|nr:beta-ketoacyl-ACP synthase III [Balneolaceae bacterium ANBcel3]
MNSKIRAKISAVGHFLPDYVLTNKELEKLVETNDEWIRTRTGIAERRLLKDPEKATAFMAAEAAREILKQRDLDPAEIDAVIVATITPDYMFPSAACLTQTMIGAKNAFAYDLSAACSGFIFALSSGAALVESGQCRKVLVLGSDKMSSIIDFSDRTTCILFGDAAAGVLIEPSEDEDGIIDHILHSSAEGAESLMQEGGGSRNPATHETVDKKMHYIRQEGRIVFKKATEGMADVSVAIMEKNGLTADDIAWLVPHQANLRIIDATARRMGLDPEKVMINIEKYGNTTAATIPLCLYDWRNKLNKGDNIILAAFGGGYTWGATYLKWAI